jgi:hypothetical protein
MYIVKRCVLMILSKILSYADSVVVKNSVIHEMNSKVESAVFDLTARGNRILDLEQDLRVHDVEILRLNNKLDAAEKTLKEDAIALEFLRKERDQAVAALVQASNRGARQESGHVNSGQPHQDTVLIVITTISQLPHLRALCSNQEFRRRYQPVVFALFAVERSDLAKFCEESSIALYNYDFTRVGAKGNLVDLPTTETSTFSDVGHNFSEGPNGEILASLSKLVSEVRRQSRTSRNIHRLLAKLRPSLLILFEDNAECRTGTIIAAANAQYIPSVIMPFTVVDEIEAAEAYFDNPDYWPESNVFNELVAKACPSWTHEHRNRVLLRSRGIVVLADEAMGTAPPLPWVLNSGHASAVAVESQAMLDHYTGNGLPVSQLEVVGGFIDDVIFSATRRADNLRSILELDRDKPVLLCSFPPNQLKGVIRQTEWQNFEELLDFWASELLSLSGWQVVVKPHPALTPNYVQRLRAAGLKVTDRDTAELIPICDLYNACVSSTIRWALACGKPVLNYDAFSYHYRDFAKEDAVLTVDTRDGFRSALERLTQDTMFLKMQTEAAQDAAPRWGQIDGQAGARVLGLFDKLTGRVWP